MIPKAWVTNLVAIMFLVSATCQVALASDDCWIVCAHRTADTDQILPRVTEGLEGIPDSVKNSLKQAGYKVVITPSMLYGGKGQKELRSDYDVHDDNAAGRFVTAEHTVYIPERCSWHNEAPRIQGNDVIHVLRHEMGHAFDCSLSYASRQEAFTAAYAQDAARLTNSQRTSFSYYAMQGTETGAIELFAELFAILCTSGDRTLRRIDRGLYEAFPHCVQVLVRLNSDFKPHAFGTENPPYYTASATSTGMETSKSGTILVSTAHSPVPLGARLMQTGIALVAQRRYSDAIPYFDSAINANPNDGIAYSHRGYAFLAIARYSQAIADYERAIALNPNDVSAVRNLALAKSMARR